MFGKPVKRIVHFNGQFSAFTMSVFLVSTGRLNARHCEQVLSLQPSGKN